MEIMAARGYQGKDYPVAFWRTKTGLEVNYVLGDGEVAVEVKTRVRARDLRGMKAFQEEFHPKRAIVVTAEQDRRWTRGIEIVPYGEFLQELHEGGLM